MRAKICGVYRIYCSRTDRSYVGSSTDILNRFTWHKFILRHNSPKIGYGLTRDHPCQEDWNTFGESMFVFEILEECSAKDRIITEQRWMDSSEYSDRYNHDVAANGAKKMPADVRAIMSEVAKERNARPEYNRMISERAKRQHSEGKLGRATWRKNVC